MHEGKRWQVYARWAMDSAVRWCKGDQSVVNGRWGLMVTRLPRLYQDAGALEPEDWALGTTNREPLFRRSVSTLEDQERRIR